MNKGLFMPSSLGSIAVLSFADHLSCGAEDGRRIASGARSRLDLLDLKGLEEDDAMVYMFVCVRPSLKSTDLRLFATGWPRRRFGNELARRLHRQMPPADSRFMGSIAGVYSRTDLYIPSRCRCTRNLSLPIDPTPTLII
jgi:hypothetical protein